MAIVLALCSALTYGLSDFVGGLVSRRTSAWSVAVVAQTSAALCTAAVALFYPGSPEGRDYAWAAAAGVASGVGACFLYRGLAAGRMSVVAPLSAVGAAVVPVAVGVFTGERPSVIVWLGVLVAIPAIWLVSSAAEDLADDHDATAPESRSAGLLDGTLAGLGFGLLFAALGQIPDSAGLWPLTLTQVVAVPASIVLATLLRASWVPRDPAVWWAVAVGPLGAAATLTFLLASQQGLLSVAGVLTSLYPASTVLLAALVLHEKIHRAQGVGLGLCVVAIGLVAGG